MVNDFLNVPQKLNPEKARALKILRFPTIWLKKTEKILEIFIRSWNHGQNSFFIINKNANLMDSSTSYVNFKQC